MYCFTGFEREGEGRATTVGRDGYDLVDQRLEMHLDAGFSGVPASLMAKVGEGEVGVEVAVEAGENVEVEGCGDAGSVVVCGEELGDAFVGAGGEVGAEEEHVSGLELST